MTKPFIERRIVFGAFRRERVSRKRAWGTADVFVGAPITIEAQADFCAIDAVRADIYPHQIFGRANSVFARQFNQISH
ncbi:hypothetical protein [Bosea sp. BIWAKO-01]|uniref:hypothetical protein n=1 Tax=Bosea sp. BIWAKO-01 TaxID=506668 RepID=UPI000853890D|nr:hypothetical protein [Bosea sp. BIWAKO-01]